MSPFPSPQFTDPCPCISTKLHHFKPKCTLFFTLCDTLFRFYFYTSQIPAPLRCSVSSEQERERSLIPQRNVSQNVRVKHFYYHYAQISAKVTYTDPVEQLGVKILRHCPVCNRLFGYEVKLIKYTPINTMKSKL